MKWSWYEATALLFAALALIATGGVRGSGMAPSLGFKAQGINIHEWTMLVPEHVHLRIHRGAQGGPWNEAWRQFREAHAGRRVPREVLMRKAFELAFRFDIVGPIQSYYSPITPPGPQLLAP